MRLPRAAALALAAIACAAGGAAGQCVRDAFPTAAGGQPFPTAALPDGELPAGAGTPSRPITQGHWSEAVTLARPAPKLAIPDFSPAACPHLQPGLVDWHSPATWGGTVPSQGNVVLPANSKVLISSCSLPTTAVNGSNTVFGTITIPATSELIIGDASIAIRARGFRVLGALRAGAPGCRLRSRISVTLHGARSDQPVSPAPDPWVKGIHVDNGSLSLHGTLYTPTWTRLAATARAGDTVLLVQDVPNWQPGQRIVVTTTELKDARDWHRNEELTISGVFRTSLGPNVAAIRVATPLSFTHYGGPEYQAEVALLSRDLLIQGNEATSEPTDTVPTACTDRYGSSYPCEDKYQTGYGGHVLVTGTRASALVSGVELYRMGQTNVLGRYPMHFHLMGSQQGKPVGAVVTDSSVHRSFFRCFAVHGTSYARLHENTAYDAMGHCYFLEDGVEENNEFHFNFGAHVHPLGAWVTPFLDSYWSQGAPWADESPSLILPSDVAAGVFYGGNAYNSFLGNAASGGWAGFAFPTLERPVKLHANVQGFSPGTRPFLLFRGNSAHSTGFWFNSAGGIYVGGQLTYKGAWGNSLLTYTPGRSKSHSTCTVPANDWCGDDDRVWLRFEDTKVFLSNRGMQHWGDRSDIVRFELADINLAANVFGQVSASGVLHTCRTGNKPAWFAGCSRAGAPRWDVGWGVCHDRDWAYFQSFSGWTWYDVGQRHIITDITFRNCRSDWDGPCVYNWPESRCAGNSIWQILTHSDEWVPEVMQATRNVTYDNVLVPRLVKFTTSLTDPGGTTVSGRLASWLDADGSVYGPYLPSLRGNRIMLGSTWAREWWRMNSDCIQTNTAPGLPGEELWACPMRPGDTEASVVLQYNTAVQSQIGNTVCINGAWDPGSVRPCPVVGTLTHFGRPETSGLVVEVNSKVTGPVIAESGGWFMRFDGGTPSSFVIQGLVVPDEARLIMAFPYPAGTQFSVQANLNWCQTWWGGVCVHDFRPVGSVAEVRDGFGDTYHFDGRVLYIRVVLRQKGGSFGTNDPWTNVQPVGVFARNGLALPEGDWSEAKYPPPDSSANYWISIRATTCPAGGRCAAQLTVPVPAALVPNQPGPIATTPRPVATTPRPVPTTARPIPTTKRITSRRKTTSRRRRTTTKRRRTSTRRKTTTRRIRRLARKTTTKRARTVGRRIATALPGVRVGLLANEAAA
ncbi:G8 domain-containing protein [Hyaloraphidium curvatum]|nr:G8 domain-containing protein [Hyaloraphidium curvatum]